MSRCDYRGRQHVSCVSIQDPKQIVSCIDFRYITDVLTEEEALGETGLGMKPLHCKMIVGEATPPASLFSFRHTCESAGRKAAER